MPSSDVNFELLFKCRLIIGRFGEKDVADWWNSTGLLSTLGPKVFVRGFPRTEVYARARSILAVASRRSADFFNPADTFSLWSLPAVIEQAFDESLLGWSRESRDWLDLFHDLERMSLQDSLGQFLLDHQVVSKTSLNTATKLKLGPEGKSILLPEIGSISDETISLLTAAFVQIEPGSFRLPIVSLRRGA